MDQNIYDKQTIRWWDWPAVLLLLAAMLTVATRLNATHWTEHLTLVQTLAFLGTVLGLALGYSRFSPGAARLLAILYGLILIVWQLGLTLGEGILWPERMVSMGNRLLITLDQLFRQKPVTDNLFFLTLMAILFWSLCVYAGYSLTRHANPWRAVLPAGLALVIVHAYDSFFPIRTWFLAGYLFLALVLVARLHFLNQHRRWKRMGTYLPPFISLDSIRLGLIATLILVLFAWTAPALASALPPAEQVWRRASAPWIAARERIGNAFSSLQASVGIVTDFYGDNLPLGRGNPLTDTIIMTVQAPPRVAAGVRYYWRARVYDYYDASWTTTFPTVQDVTPDTFKLEFPDYQARSEAEFTIQTNLPIQNLQTPSQPLWISRPAQARFANNPDGTIDLAYLKATPLLNAGDVYQVQASLTAASVADLRTAGTEYPVWITDRYLQLPASITPRTKQLAAQIASGLDNPYDIAQAVTNYLRSNINYSETIPTPPAGQEPVDWVLFDYRQAFCNYYATAEIILLRSLGIPARLAVGYAQGERKALEEIGVLPTVPAGGNVPQVGLAGDLYTVRHRDAHAWPEIFFPGIGWVEFEPTVSQLPILRPETNTDNPAANNELNRINQERENLAENRQNQNTAASGQNPLGQLGNQLQIPVAVWILLAGGLLALGMAFIRRVRRRRGSPPIPVQLEAGLRRVGLQPPSSLRRWARFAVLNPLARAYLELNRALARLGRRPTPTDTPAERGATLEELLPVVAVPIRTLIAEYQVAIYSQRNGDEIVAQRAGSEIRKQSYLARIKRLLVRFQEPVKRKRSPWSR